MAKKFTDLTVVSTPLVDNDIIAISKDINTDQTFYESQQLSVSQLRENLGLAPKVYKALLTQTLTLDPDATVLVNTLSGTPLPERQNTGEYTLTLSGEFPDSSKVIILMNNGASFSLVPNAYVSDSNTITINTYDNSFALSDSILELTAITIEVYP